MTNDGDAAIATASPSPLADQPATPGLFVGPWYAWWPGDPLPALPALPDFAAAPTADDHALAALSGSDDVTLEGRRRADNQPYLATLNGTPVAYGWSASATVEIGELGLTFALPPGDRYLWDFATLPAWRGRGIYPHLLQAILRHGTASQARHWIGHEPDNLASTRGILKAGFRLGAALLGADLALPSATPITPPI